MLLGNTAEFLFVFFREPELQKLREQYKACPKEDHWTVLEKLQVEDPPHSADELNLYESAFHELDNDSSE